MGVFGRRRGGSITGTARYPRSLTASGERVTREKGEQNQLLANVQKWQALAFRYYDQVPEINYGAQFYSRYLPSVELFAGYRNDDGEVERTDNEVAIEQLERVQDPGGGRTRLLAAWGKLRFLVGEAQILVSIDSETQQEQWEALSTLELRRMGSTYMRFRAPNLMPENYQEVSDDDYEPVEDDQAVVYRLWNPHPVWSKLADCSMRAALEVCEELVSLTSAIRAQTLNRMIQAGILLVNDRYLPPDLKPTADDDPLADPVLRPLIEAIQAAIKDPGSAAALAPILLRVEADNLEQVMKHIRTASLDQLYPEAGLRYEATKRLALGLDMPPEALLGISETNHWNAWQVDDLTWKAHLQPVMDQFVGDLGSAFYRPTLREEGLEDWDRYCIGYDPAAAIINPDRGKDAKDLFDAGELSGEAYRGSKGYGEDDAPSDEERNRYVGIRIRDGSLAVFGIPTVGRGALEPEEGEIEEGDTSPESSGEVEKAPPEPTDAERRMAALEVEARLARILGACDVALHRARELAGNKLRSRAKRDPEAAKLIDGVPATEVAATLGRERAAALGAGTERELVTGGRELLAQTLERQGLDRKLAEPLADRIEQHVARHLWDEVAPPLPQSFGNYVAGLVKS